jgi:hypothetical protein
MAGLSSAALAKPLPEFEREGVPTSDGGALEVGEKPSVFVVGEPEAATIAL